MYLLANRQQWAGGSGLGRRGLTRRRPFLKLGQSLLPGVLGPAQFAAQGTRTSPVAGHGGLPYLRAQLVDALLQLLYGLSHEGHCTVIQSLPAISSNLIDSDIQITHCH